MDDKVWTTHHRPSPLSNDYYYNGGDKFDYFHERATRPGQEILLAPWLGLQSNHLSPRLYLCTMVDVCLIQRSNNMGIHIWVICVDLETDIIKRKKEEKGSALLHSVERWSQARPTSDLVLAPQSLTLFKFKFLNMFIYTNYYSISKFTFNYNLWHYAKKVLNFVVDELMYASESSTSRLIFWLGISG